MDLAVAISAHPEKPDVVVDTIDSIRVYGTDKVLMVVDAVGWHRYKDVPMPCHKLEGFHYGCAHAPYRNVALSLSVLCDMWPDSDWYCYCDYDVLFASDRFKRNLKMAEEKGIWMMGNDGHVDSQAMPLIQAMIGEEFKSCYYLLGCLHFYHRNFINKLKEINFFERFLTLTSGFGNGFFPFYSGYDLTEHMYPTLCRHFGGNIGVFATYDGVTGEWHGSHDIFPMRWKPEINPETENFPEASIFHPLKSYDHPIRVQHREKRQQEKSLRNSLRNSQANNNV